MKKIILGLLAFAVVLMALVVPTTAEAGTPYSPPVVCKTRHSYSSGTVNDLPGDRTALVSIEVKYQACKNRLGPNFSRPSDVWVKTDISGRSMRCSDGIYNQVPSHTLTNRGHVKTTFNIYFYESNSGANFKLREFSIPCQSDTTSTGHQSIGKRTSVQLTYPTRKPDSSPVRFRANAKFDYKGYHDGHTSVFGKMFLTH